MRSPVWTIEDLREYGDPGGWWYGFIRYEGKLHFAELYPGGGFCSPFPMWHPRSWWWALRDVWAASQR